MKGYVKRYFAIILAMCMMLYSVPIAQAEQQSGFVDMPGEAHWAYQALNCAVQNGVLVGENRHLNPTQSLTRAQMAAVMNRVFGAEEQADLTQFSDVHATDWFYSDMAKAVRMGTFIGDGNMLYPNQVMNRQDVMLVLARALNLNTADRSNLSAYTDSDQISEYAKDAVATMLRAGYISGYTDQTFRPQDSLTREQMAQILYNIFHKYVNVPGTYTGVEEGNVIINVPDVTLQDTTITGDLILGDGVGNGTVTLDNVAVTGRVLVRGGGENSLRIINGSNVGSIIVTKSSSGKLRILSSEGARVDMVYVEDGQDTLILEGTFKNVAVEGENETLLRNANITHLSVNASAANVSVESGTVSNTVIGQTASKAQVSIGKNAEMGTVDVTADASIDVAGSVAHLTIASGIQGSVSVSVQDDATVTRLEVQKNSETVINVSNSATIKDIAVSDKDKVQIEADKNKKQELENKITPVEKPSAGNSGNSNTGHDSSSGGNDPDPAGTVVSTFSELKAAAANQSVSAITVSGNIVIDDDFQCSKPVTIQRDATVTISDYAIFYDSLVNRGTLNTTVYGRLHIGYKAAFTNHGTAQNSGDWFIYGTIKNTGTYLDFGTEYGTINAFSGATVVGMPKTTVYAIYGDCYYADGTFRKSQKETDFTTDENITLYTSGDTLQALAYGQVGYDNVLNSQKSYRSLHLIADRDTANHAIRLSGAQRSTELTVGDGVHASISENASIALKQADLYGTLNIDAGSRLQTNSSTVRTHGTLVNEGDFDSRRTYMHPYATALGMDGVDIQMTYGRIDYYYADGSVERAIDTITVTGNVNVSTPSAAQAYVYGEAGLLNALSSEIEYRQIVVAYDGTNKENNSVHLRTSTSSDCSIRIAAGVTVSIEPGVTLSTSNLEVYGTLKVNGTFLGEYISIRDNSIIYNYGTINLTKRGYESTIRLNNGILENHGSMVAVDSVIWARGRGQLLDLPGNITVQMDSYDFYGADGSIDLDEDQITVTGDAKIDDTTVSDIQGNVGLTNYFATGKSYQQVELTIPKGETVTLPSSMKLSRLNIRIGSKLIVPKQVKVTLSNDLRILNKVQLDIQPGGFFTAERIYLLGGGTLTNYGTLDCGSLRIDDDSIYEDGVYEEGTDTALINEGHMVVNGEGNIIVSDGVTITGAHSQLIHAESAYFACYDGKISVQAGATLTIHGKINPSGQQTSGFYYSDPIYLYPHYYDDMVLESKVEADQAVDTVVRASYFVTTEEGLRRALESDADEIQVDAPITLTSDLELTKQVYFSELTVTNNATVNATSGWSCNTLTIQDGTVQQSEGRANISMVNLASEGKLIIETNGELYRPDTVRNDGAILNRGLMYLSGNATIQGNGTITNENVIRISGTYNYDSLPDLSWIRSLPGTVETSISIRVASLDELKKVIASGVVCEQIVVRSDNDTSVSLVIDEDLDLGGYAISFDNPVNITSNTTVKGADEITFRKDLQLYGTLDVNRVYVYEDFVAGEESLLKVNVRADIDENAEIHGTLDLTSGRIYFSGETTFGESMQVLWPSETDDAHKYFYRISCDGTVHQLGDLIIPEGERLEVRSNKGYYEVLGRLDNYGSIYIGANSSLYVNNDAELSNNGGIQNYGMLKVQAQGMLTNAGSIWNDGTIQVNEGGMFLNTENGVIEGNGTTVGDISQPNDSDEQDTLSDEESEAGPDSLDNSTPEGTTDKDAANLPDEDGLTVPAPEESDDNTSKPPSGEEGSGEPGSTVVTEPSQDTVTE